MSRIIQDIRQHNTVKNNIMNQNKDASERVKHYFEENYMNDYYFTCYTECCLLTK